MNLDMMEIIKIIDIVGRITIDILAGIGLNYIVNVLNQRFK